MAVFSLFPRRPLWPVFTIRQDSIFNIIEVAINLNTPLFFPISELNELRRKTLALLEVERLKNYTKESFQITKNNVSYPEKKIDYKGNILNQKATQFYKRHGAEITESAFEIQTDFTGKEIMTTRHCIKYQMGACEKYEKNPVKISEPLYIEDNNRKYKLEFDCTNCVMKVISL